MHVLLLAALGLAADRPMGDDDKSMYLHAVEAHFVVPAALSYVDREPIPAPGLGFRSRLGQAGGVPIGGAVGLQLEGFPGLEGRARLLCDVLVAPNGLKGWYVGPRVLASHLDYVRPRRPAVWALAAELGAGWRGVWHPGLTVSTELALAFPVAHTTPLRGESYLAPQLRMSMTMGWALGPGPRPTPGYRSREITGHVKPEIVVLELLPVALVVAWAASVGSALGSE